MVYAKKKKPVRRKDTTPEPPKQEEIIGAVDKAVNAIAMQWKAISVVVVGIAVVLGAISLYNSSRAGKEDAAAAMLYDAEMELPDPAGFALSPSDALDADQRAEELRAVVPEFDKVIEEHSSTVSADIAALEAGHALFEAGDVESAATRYAEAETSKSRLVRLLAVSAHATALETLEKHEDAAAKFRLLVDEGSGAIKEYAYVDLVRVQETSGDAEAALATCREFETELPDSPLLGSIQDRIRALGGEVVEAEPLADTTQETL